MKQGQYPARHLCPWCLVLVPVRASGALRAHKWSEPETSLRMACPGVGKEVRRPALSDDMDSLWWLIRERDTHVDDGFNYCTCDKSTVGTRYPCVRRRSIERQVRALALKIRGQL